MFVSYAQIEINSKLHLVHLQGHWCLLRLIGNYRLLPKTCSPSAFLPRWHKSTHACVLSGLRAAMSFVREIVCIMSKIGAACKGV